MKQDLIGRNKRSDKGKQTILMAFAQTDQHRRVWFVVGPVGERKSQQNDDKSNQQDAAPTDAPIVKL